MLFDIDGRPRKLAGNKTVDRAAQTAINPAPKDKMNSQRCT